MKLPSKEHLLRSRASETNTRSEESRIEEAPSSAKNGGLDSVGYYDRHAQEFIDGTLQINMTALYRPFLMRLPAGAHILDAGCGSGRDSQYFLQAGFLVTAMDASRAMVDFSTPLLEQPVHHLRFQDVTWQERFEGIWACASLLHVPASDLPEMITRLANALKNDGIFFLSFKYGEGERQVGERRFTDANEQAIECLLAEVKDLSLLKVWRTKDQRPQCVGQMWLNVLLRKEKS